MVENNFEMNDSKESVNEALILSTDEIHMSNVVQNAKSANNNRKDDNIENTMLERTIKLR